MLLMVCSSNIYIGSQSFDLCFIEAINVVFFSFGRTLCHILQMGLLTHRDECVWILNYVLLIAHLLFKPFDLVILRVD